MKIIEIVNEEVQIGDIILEKGDKIKVIESTQDFILYAYQLPNGKFITTADFSDFRRIWTILDRKIKSQELVSDPDELFSWSDEDNVDQVVSSQVLYGLGKIPSKNQFSTVSIKQVDYSFIYYPRLNRLEVYQEEELLETLQEKINKENKK